jgi:hypothetical protein
MPLVRNMEEDTMNIKSFVPQKVGLIFVAILLAACKLFQEMPTVVLPQAMPTYTLTATVTTMPLPLATATVPPSATPTARPRATRTRITLPTATATKTITPTPILSPTSTLPPIKLNVADCDTTDIQPGQRVLLEAYLALSAGKYFLNEPTLPVYITTDTEDYVGSTDAVSGWITNGKGRNSMYFEGRRPIIIDDTGATIPWMKKGGYEVYITNQPVRLIGTFQYKYNDIYCHVEIEKVYYWSDPPVDW